MCKRYIITQKIATIEKRFNLDATLSNDYQPSYNVSKGDLMPVITNEYPKQLQFINFGMTPFWAKTRMDLLNARVEGDRNKVNSSQYTGAKAITNMKAFRKPIRSQRCLVIADAFILGAEAGTQAHVVYLKDKVRPFAFAGLWDVWHDKDGVELYSFTIVTSTANDLIRQLGQERSPVILRRNRELAWLNNNLPLADVIRYLSPYPAHLMGAYPIADTIKNPFAEGRHLLDPMKLVTKEEQKVKAVIDFGHYGGWRLKVN